MRRSIKRWLAIMLLGTLGFAQASLALAACAMDRGQLADMSAQSHECCDETASAACGESMVVPTNVCFMGSTADLQAVAAAMSNADAPVQVVAWFVPDTQLEYVLAARSPASPPKSLPPRILLHSFLI